MFSKQSAFSLKINKQINIFVGGILQPWEHKYKNNDISELYSKFFWCFDIFSCFLKAYIISKIIVLSFLIKFEYNRAF